MSGAKANAASQACELGANGSRIPAEETADLVRKVMEGAALPAQSISVPPIAEAGIADNWAEAH
jgi:DNA polymerase I-like protein with 3'-5' exonuclease and polymerase domains